MLYFGRVGGGYFWALEGRGVYYLYERSSRTKWRTVYRGRFTASELAKMFGLVRAAAGAVRTAAGGIPERWREFIRTAVERYIAYMPAKVRNAIAEEIGDLLDELGIELDEDG